MLAQHMNKLLYIGLLALFIATQTITFAQSLENYCVEGYVEDIEWSSGGTHLIVATANKLWIYDSSNLKNEPDSIDFPFAPILATESLANGDLVAISTRIDYSRALGVDNMVFVVDVATGNFIATLFAGRARVSALRFSQNGQFLATGTGYGEITLWDTENWRPVSTWISPNGILTFAFHPTEPISATGGGYHGDPYSVIHLWDIQSEAMLVELDHQLSQITDITFSSDGANFLSSSLDSTVNLWDTQTTLRGFPPYFSLEFPDWVNSVILASDDDTVYSRILGDAVYQWSISELMKQGQLTDVGQMSNYFIPFSPLQTVRSLALSPDNTQLATGYGCKIWIWDTELETLEVELTLPR